MKSAIEAALEAEMTEALSAAKGERTEARLDDRAGYYQRSLITRIGTLELRVRGRPAGQRCRRFVGIDPSTNIYDTNSCTSALSACCRISAPMSGSTSSPPEMVVEHIVDPITAVAALARLVKPDELVVIYTVEKLSPVTFLSAVTPIGFHHAVKEVLWGAEERDTFPTVYKMNSRRELCALFEAAGFREASFCHLDDCRAFGRWRALNAMELTAWRCFNAVGLRYPDACILATYRRKG